MPGPDAAPAPGRCTRVGDRAAAMRVPIGTTYQGWVGLAGHTADRLGYCVRVDATRRRPSAGPPPGLTPGPFPRARLPSPRRSALSQRFARQERESARPRRASLGSGDARRTARVGTDRRRAGTESRWLTPAHGLPAILRRARVVSRSACADGLAPGTKRGVRGTSALCRYHTQPPPVGLARPEPPRRASTDSACSRRNNTRSSPPGRAARAKCDQASIGHRWTGPRRPRLLPERRH